MSIFSPTSSDIEQEGDLSTESRILSTDCDEESNNLDNVGVDDSDYFQSKVIETGRPSTEMTIEESVDKQNVEEESVIVRSTRKLDWRKRRPVIESSSDDEDEDKSSNSENSNDSSYSEEESEEEEAEERALSPRTRMSITGVRPVDLESDSSDNESEDDDNADQDDDNADQDNEIAPTNEESAGHLKNISNTADVDNESYRKHQSNESIDNSFPLSSSENEAAEVDYNRKADLPRYSTHFMKCIKKQLSSTLFPTQESAEVTEIVSSREINETQEEIKVSTKQNKSGDSEIEIIETNNPIIEVGSSDEDDNKENNVHNGDKNKIVPKETYKEQEVPLKPTPKPLKQSTIPSILRKSLSSTPKKPVKSVSQEFYDKEVRKLSELKSELENAQRLIGIIGKNLPDGGRQLELRIQNLQRDIQIKSNYIATFYIEDAPENLRECKKLPLDLKREDDAMKSSYFQELQAERKSAFKKEVPDWNELSAAVNDIKPIHTGKQGMATFNTQKTLTIDRLKDLHNSLEDCPGEDVLAEDPRGLRVNLMAHQKHALAWMTWREKKRPRGGILADDMGLGKTLTMISLILAHKNRRESENGESSDEEVEEERNLDARGNRKYYRGGTLVICPASLVSQWENEVDTKISRNRLTVCVHHGNNRDTKPKHLRSYDIVVTTYNIAAREHKTAGAIFGLNWRRIILDEAHVVRNHKAQSSIAVSELMGKYRWALTGTPIQNKEMDVYALMKFLHCTPFDELPHWRKWIDKSAGGKQRLNTIMKTLMLRRTKIQLQERGELKSLPLKSIEMIEVVLEKEEMNVYQKIMIYSRTLFAEFLNQRADRNTDLMYREQANRPTYMQTKDPNGAYYQMHKQFTKLHQGSHNIKSHEILVLLLRLRQICCHPGLIDAMLENDDGQQKESESEEDQPEIDLLEQLNRLTIKDDALGDAVNTTNNGEKSLNADEQVIAKASAKVLQRSNPVFDLKRPSSKMTKVLKTLRERVFKSDDKAIIVSQWTSVLDILRTHLENDGVSTLSLNGSIPVKLRQGIVSEFNDPSSNKRILLLSLTAGGVGLNLVGANHLLLIDLHWNPQLEAQAQDRIYRVGQKKNVTIYKFMCKDTVEERIKRLQEVKLDLANGVLTGTKGGSKLTIDDLRSLFDV